MENSGELVHGEPVLVWEVTHILAVMNNGKPAGFKSYLQGEEVSLSSVH